MNIVKSNDFENEIVHAKLRNYNRNYMSELNDYSFHIEEDNKIIAGIVANSTYKTLEIEYLFVDEKYRHQGLGSMLLKHVEDIAKQNKLEKILVNTYSFQAPQFYIKNGYNQLFKIDNCFNGYDQYYFFKGLTNEQD